MPLRRCACSGLLRYAAAHRPPLLRLPPVGPCLAVRSALPPARRRSGASVAACGVTAAPWRSPPRLAASACRRLRRPATPAPPLAPRRLAAPPAAASGGSVPWPSPRSLRSPLGCCGWACGPPSAPLRAPCVPSGGARRRVPPVRPGPPPALPRPSVGWRHWPGFGLRGSCPGASGGPAGRFLRLSGPGVWGLGIPPLRRRGCNMWAWCCS